MCFWICFSLDGADDTNKSEKNDKNDQKSGDSSQTSGEKQSDLDSTSTSHHCKCAKPMHPCQIYFMQLLCGLILKS